jgi:hypothetical protein
MDYEETRRQKCRRSNAREVEGWGTAMILLGLSEFQVPMEFWIIRFLLQTKIGLFFCPLKVPAVSVGVNQVAQYKHPLSVRYC